MDSKLDIIIIGATGFTGRFVTKKLASVTIEAAYADINWGIAGRTRKKMQDLLNEVAELGVDMSKVPIMECDIVNGKDTIKEVTKRAKVVLNATGPCTILSAPVVKACIETGTHYLDISAELYQMLNLYREYNTAAENANVLIVPNCGFSSIPVTAGLSELQSNLKGTLRSVECYTEFGIPLRAHILFTCYNNSLIHYGTWDSLVYELRNYKRYQEQKKQTFSVTELPPPDLQKSFFHRHNGRCWYPYPGPENDVVEQSQLYQRKNGKSQYYFKIYTTMPLFIHYILVPVFFIFYWMSYFTCFRKILRKFPRLCTGGLVSHQGPSEKMRDDTKFSFTLNGKGWSHGANLDEAPDKQLTVKVSGKDPGYQTTAVSFILAAITLLRERSKMPAGGVFVPAAVFNDTHLANELVKHGIQIEII